MIRDNEYRPPPTSRFDFDDQKFSLLITFIIGIAVGALLLVATGLGNSNTKSDALAPEKSREVAYVLTNVARYRNAIGLESANKLDLLSERGFLSGYVIAGDVHELNAELFLILVDQMIKCPGLQIGADKLSAFTEPDSALAGLLQTCWTGERSQTIIKEMILPILSREGPESLISLWAPCASCSKRYDVSNCSKCGERFKERGLRFIDGREPLTTQSSPAN